MIYFFKYFFFTFFKEIISIPIFNSKRIDTFHLNFRYTTSTHNMSIGSDVSVGYTLNKVHAFSLAAAVNKYGHVNIVNRRSSLDQTDMNISLNYIYPVRLFLRPLN